MHLHSLNGSYHLKVVRLLVSPPGQVEILYYNFRSGNFFIALYSHHTRVTELTADRLGSLLTYKVELRSPDAGALNNGNGVNDGRIKRIRLLHADAGESRADGERPTGFGAVFDREDEALKRLLACILNSLLFFVGTASLLQFNDVLEDSDGIARAYPELGAPFYIDW